MRRLALIAALAMAGGTASAEGFPFNLGGSFTLADQTGATRSEADPEGRAQLLFFGYANCEQICSAALPLMAEAADILAGKGHAVVPVMITVDPANDTPAKMAEKLALFHPGFVGLTGEAAALEAAYETFGVEIEELFVDPFGQPVYAHGSFVFLLDGAGEVLTVIPPILAPEEVAGIAAPYLAAPENLPSR